MTKIKYASLLMKSGLINPLIGTMDTRLKANLVLFKAI